MLVLWGADLLREYPQQELVRQAYERVPYLISEAIIPPLGKEYFKAILPSAAPGEVYGTYVNMEARLQVAMASVQPPGQARPTKTYVTTWAYALKKPMALPQDWDAYDDNSGDLIPMEPMPSVIHPISPLPTRYEDEFELVTGSLVIENGMPSDILTPRVPRYPGRISVKDAELLGINEQGMVALTKDGKEIQVQVQVDREMTPGRIFVPMGVSDFPVNRVGAGPVEVSRVEEVHTV